MSARALYCDSPVAPGTGAPWRTGDTRTGANPRPRVGLRRIDVLKPEEPGSLPIQDLVHSVFNLLQTLTRLSFNATVPVLLGLTNPSDPLADASGGPRSGPWIQLVEETGRRCAAVIRESSENSLGIGTLLQLNLEVTRQLGYGLQTLMRAAGFDFDWAQIRSKVEPFLLFEDSAMVVDLASLVARMGTGAASPASAQSSLSAPVFNAAWRRPGRW